MKEKYLLVSYGIFSEVIGANMIELENYDFDPYGDTVPFAVGSNQRIVLIDEASKDMMKFIAKEQLTKAEKLGVLAHQSGKMRSACLDHELMQMVNGRDIGKHPEGEASSIALYESWSNGWDKSNLS